MAGLLGRIFISFSMLFLQGSGLFATALDPQELKVAIEEKLKRVHEFRLLYHAAEMHGVRIWLWGGAASAMAHYTKWFLERTRNNTQFRPNFFSFKLNQILPADADVDLVIDGPAHQIEAFLKVTKDFLPGRELQWATLWANTQGKASILLPAFTSQTSDSHSLGLIELTTPPVGESRIRYAGDWKSDTGGQFLEDAAAGKIEFIRKESHYQTPRALSGMNPEMLAVIRYLIKAFQFNLNIPMQSMEAIEEIISSTSIDRSPPSYYVRKWIGGNARKLFTRSIDLNRSHKIMSDLDLISRISLLLSKEDRKLLRREPLRVFKVGLGNGKTAAELGLDLVAHRSSSAESIERMKFGPGFKPNLLKSRIDADNERAQYGDGFYVLEGRQGDPTSGNHNIRFHLNQNARLGSDFDLIEGYIETPKPLRALRILNCAALNIVDEEEPILGVSSGFLAGGQGWTQSPNQRRLPFYLNRHSAVWRAHTLLTAATWISILSVSFFFLYYFPFYIANSAQTQLSDPSRLFLIDGFDSTVQLEKALMRARPSDAAFTKELPRVLEAQAKFLNEYPHRWLELLRMPVILEDRERFDIVARSLIASPSFSKLVAIADQGIDDLDVHQLRKVLRIGFLDPTLKKKLSNTACEKLFKKLSLGIDE